MLKKIYSFLKIDKPAIAKEEYLALIAALAYSESISTDYSFNYLDRAQKYTLLLATNLIKQGYYKKKLNSHYITILTDAVTVYDLGKNRIPESILTKTNLTPDEWKIIKEHCLYGAQIINKALAKNPGSLFLQICLEVSLYHHEHFDGSGYPYGLKGEDIPLSARIVALVDVYNAMRTNRPYRPAWGHQGTLEYILGQKGKQFDPLIVDTFLKIHLQFRALARQLDDFKDDLLAYEQKYKQQKKIKK